ncbi:hypothetical protein DHX103_12070 [Planococcus sp. X10-3]|uniref:hypothetical protein n=1 Tax=Planococcus sp. X10-3 TaxID=3061240 RepID=UPI003BB0DD25
MLNKRQREFRKKMKQSQRKQVQIGVFFSLLIQLLQNEKMDYKILNDDTISYEY